MPRCFVSIGSNIDRERHVTTAVRELARRYGPLTLSRVYESAPVGFSGDNFYNLVAAFDTEEPLPRLLARLAEIELSCGRRRDSKSFESRTLDIDLLLYGELCRHDHETDLPRREIREHAFVLRPLSEIAADVIHPETGMSIGRMWRRFTDHRQGVWPAAFQLSAKGLD